MPSGRFHKQYYDELAGIVPHFKYDWEILSMALDARIRNKKRDSHQSFTLFRQEYRRLELRFRRFRTSTLESLRYLWVNHLVVDFVYNRDLAVFGREHGVKFGAWKVIATMGPQYLRYGFGLARRLGVPAESLRILRRKLEKPGFFMSVGGARRWFDSRPHYEHRLVGDPGFRAERDSYYMEKNG